jgi:hypothetical protein
MSVRVAVDIGNGAAFRGLEISLISEPQLDENGRRDLDQVGLYEAKCTKRLGEPASRSVTVTHRYGDDVFVLIANAARQLRASFGDI